MGRDRQGWDEHLGGWSRKRVYVINTLLLPALRGVNTNFDHHRCISGSHCICARRTFANMPLVRKLLICAAIDGLVLQPRSHPHSQQQQAIRIDYKGNVGPLLNNNHEEDDTLSSFESHGVVGMSTSIAQSNNPSDV
jgi:hypothetical protein